MDRVGDKRERSTEQALDEDSKRLKSAAAAVATEELREYINHLSQRGFSVEKITDLIDKKGANPNVLRMSDSRPLLIWMCILGGDEVDGAFHGGLKTVFSFLLSREDINVNFRESNGNMLIHYVSNMADGWFLNTLLTKNPESCEYINSLDSCGLSPLHKACGLIRGPIQNVVKLLDAGASPYQRDRIMGLTPLHYALFYYQYFDIMDKLTGIFDTFFKFGVRIDNQVDNKGDTIMHLVARYVDDVRFCAKILNNGGDQNLHVQNVSGFTPLEEAMLQDSVHVVWTIQKFLRRPLRAG
jgi:hypothetical protein